MWISIGSTCLFPLLSYAGSTSLNAVGAGFKGSTGLFIVPTAEVMEYGRLGFSFNNFLLSGYPADAEAQNYYVSAGVWEGLEIQIGLNDIHPQGADPYKYLDFYKRDLVGNFKYSHRLSALDPRLRVAIGGQDIAGTVVYSQLFYGVATFTDNFGSFSLGYATDAESTLNHTKPENLHHLFGGVSLNLPYGFTAIAEYDGTNQRAGIGYSSPNLFGSGIGFNLRASLLNDRQDEDQVISAGFSVPLGRERDEVSSSESEFVHRDVSPSMPNESTARYQADEQQLKEFPAAEPVAGVNKEEYDLLVAELEKSGLQYVEIASQGDTLYVRYQNRLFDWSEIDALAQVIALVSPYAYARQIPNLVIDVLSEQNPVVRISLASLWGMKGRQTPHAFSSDKPRYFEPNFEQVNAFSRQPIPLRNGAKRTELFSVKLEPKIVNTIGTEFGAFDYSLGIETEVSAELWKGGRLSINRMDVLHNSYNFESGGHFDDYALNSGFQQAVLQQTLVPFDGFVNTLSFHQSLSDSDSKSIVDQWRYYAFDGRHQLYGYGAYNWKNDLSGNQDNDYYGFGGYELYWPEKGLSFSIEHGKYLDQDRTTKVGVKSYIGDSSFRASLMRESSGYEKAYVGFTVPLTPKKAIAVRGMTIRGESKWSYGTQTMTDNPANASGNINIGDSRYKAFGFYVSQPYEPHDAVMDSGRLTPVYLRSKKAYLKALVDGFQSETVPEM
ncbi:YjbH domain-containing protein [Thiomicrorhabdus sp.]|uniref:YjbH domain-containing protein n=1 Tax=Thiomicrorhabdus sp. TaxID=2039724 RepID=UPI0029C76171|nr:YjbH domain-containing protein [Thiomicrorhabdus sp.]